MTITLPTLRCAALAAGLFLFGVGAHGAAAESAAATRPATWANPVDLPYRFRIAKQRPANVQNWREAADPTMVFFQGEYWLFASKSGGYWHTRDLRQWEFVVPTGLPIEDYAPTVVVIDGKLHWTAIAEGNRPQQLFRTDDPAKGVWTPVSTLKAQGNYGDPALFVDDDGRVFMYYGLSNNAKFSVTELDPKNGFAALRTETMPASRAPAERGWENQGDNNERATPPWLEGAWANKHNGKYYVQYAGPGTEFKTYGDGVLVGDNPMGPFRYAPYSPFSFKPTGFVAGAGHGSTFAGADGKWWHIATMTISMRDIFERRLGLFPTRFEPDGQLVTDTYLADYPRYLGGDRGLVGWMLLSYDKPVTASSTLDGHEPAQAADEDIRTWWSAKTGDAGEWLQMDLGGVKHIEAVQMNFADEGVTTFAPMTDTKYGYVLEASDDGKTWKAIVDRRTAMRDAVNDYAQLDEPVMARHVRITNTHTPAGGKFSLSGLRVFGHGMGVFPGQVTSVKATRHGDDPRRALVEWPAAAGADFYVVRYGIAPDKLFNSYQVYQATQLNLGSLNRGTPYWFAVDAVNENGIRMGTATANIAP